MAPIVLKLQQLIDEQRWRAAFEAAIEQVAAQRVPELAAIRTLDDHFRFLDEMVAWAPREAGDSQHVHDKLVAFHFVLGQPALKALQTPVAPDANGQTLSPLSAWINEFANAWGSFLDTAASARHVESFRTSTKFQWDDYMPPPSGYLTFNQFFARHVKPGRRPVSALCDPRVVVSPVDASFMGQWPIAASSTVAVAAQTVRAKGMTWSIAQLLHGSPYAERFAGGVFTHSALRTFDYHRWHSPVEGTVLEARIVRGQAMLDVTVVDSEDKGTGKGTGEGGEPRRRLHAVEGTGFQFVQTRGLVVLQSPIGLVACLPVGMAQVSSVVITAEVGSTLRKGEEMGYFQFGGSDFVMLFEAGCEIRLACAIDQHFLQGQAIAMASEVTPHPG